MVAVRLVVGRGGGREFQAAGSHTERLPLFCDVQQLYLPAGQDEVTVEQLRGAPPPFTATANATASALQLRGLEDIWRGIPEPSTSTSTPADTQPSS